MTATEKYLAMNNNFCKLRDAIFESDVEEADEHPFMEHNVKTALFMICQYLDYYKKINNVHTREKSKMTTKQRHYIEFIEEMTGVQYHYGESVSDYIKANQEEAHRKWELECYAHNCEHEDAGDRL